MKSFLFIFFSLLIYLSKSYCSNSFTPLFSDCTFYYTFSDAACSDFQFIKCTWEQCVEQQTINNSTVCKRYQTKYDSGWNYCTDHCCLKVYPYAYESLQQCEDDLKDFYATVAIILLIIVGVMFAIGAIFVFVKFMGQKVKSAWQGSAGCRQSCINFLTCKCLRMMGRSQMAQFAEQHEAGNAINWNVTQNLSGDEQKICGACYRSGCTIRLECQHLFHRQCARDFMRYGGECITCKTKCANEIRIYCDECKRSYFRSMVEYYHQMQPHLCPNCETAIN